ncbi:MAG TPA: helix-turn-helix domain-containing protein [Chryseolinea sp.]|nr:helix-turn-helix domain-containing protein [Chryseolinea sp.]
MNNSNPFEILKQDLSTQLAEIKVLLLALEERFRAVAPSTNEQELIGIKEASNILNLAIPTIYGLVSRRELISYKRARKLYFKRSELVQWIQSGKRSSVFEIHAKAKKFNGYQK